MLTGNVNTWSRPTSLGTGRFSYDRTYKVWSFEVKDMSFRQFTDLEKFLNLKREPAQETGPEEETPKSPTVVKDQSGTPRRQTCRKFSKAEIECAHAFIDNDKLGTWRSLAEHLRQEGFPARATEVVFSKFRDYAETVRAQQARKASRQGENATQEEKKTEDNSGPKATLQDNEVITNLVKSDEGFRRLLDARHSFVNDREKERFEAYRQARNAKRPRPFKDDGTIVMTDAERQKELSAKYVSNDTARTYASEGWDR